MVRQMDDFIAPLAFRRPHFGFNNTEIPAADVHESEGMYVIETEMPGVKKDNIKFELIDDHTLLVRGEVKKEDQGRRSGERYYGVLERVFTIPNKIEPDKVQAELKDGVLKVEIPKKEQEHEQLQIAWKD
jgi:HSP20 family protein